MCMMPLHLHVNQKLDYDMIMMITKNDVFHRKIHILAIYNVILVFSNHHFWHVHDVVCDCLPSMNKASKMVLRLEPNY